MYKFTADMAREIVATEGFIPRGVIIDRIRQAAKEGEKHLYIGWMTNIQEGVIEDLVKDGGFEYDAEHETLSWETEDEKLERLAKEAAEEEQLEAELVKLKTAQ